MKNNLRVLAIIIAVLGNPLSFFIGYSLAEGRWVSVAIGFVVSTILVILDTMIWLHIHSLRNK